MPCTVKGKPLKKVSLSLTSRDICRGHCDIVVVLSQYMDSLSSLVPTVIGLYGVTTSLPMFAEA